MYPDFQYLLHGIFGVDMPEWLSIFKTFGFFVALAFLGAAWTLTQELKRKEQQGLLIPTIVPVEVGKPASANELFWSVLLGFVLGYKIGGIIGDLKDVTPNPLGYIFSIKGSLLVGILGALVLGYSKYIEKKKRQLPEPVIKKVAIYPHQRIGEMVVIAAVGGLIGAKIFNAFESWDDFIRDPAGNLLSSSGLTFYGGLIVATAAFYYYARKYKIPFHHLCDAIAPGLMLAYGFGRFGCQFSGDGDWGIFNSAYVTQPDNSLRLSSRGDYMHSLYYNREYFLHYLNYPNYISVPNAHVAAPSWLPQWMFAMNFPHNVAHEGIAIAGCTGDYCSVLPVGVFPTSFYEAITCIILFFVLWSIRKRIKYPLHLFGIYLILNGIERFLIETIRVNYKYNLGFIHPSQAEIISTLLVIAGICILLFYKKKNEIVSEKVVITPSQ
ncbi:MAG TPA: prolipoprotein diacylglyceryl transferase family protein [Flavipsychrobacter sp.]|nr:prolipoprotein diacylglyceryl transferase family protein [Flavipsychrobacter sp.]